MSFFVSVEQTNGAGQASVQRLFEGEVVALEAAPVTDFVLTDLSRQRKLAQVFEYPHWTESGMLLLLRLLSVSRPISELAGTAAGSLMVSLKQDVAALGAREFPSIHVHPGWLELSLICLETVDYARVVGASPGVSVQDAIQTA